jgi:ElaA protein
MNQPLEIHWRWLGWSALSLDRLYALLRLRTQVFVVEQQCVFQDMDGLDAASVHLCGFNALDELLAYARVLPPGLKYAEASIGRVLVPESLRGLGLGQRLMREALDGTMQRFPKAPIRIGAQQRLERFYQAFGFVTLGEPYLEDGIWHVEMLRGATSD